MAKQKFERNKPHVNVADGADVHHGYFKLMSKGFCLTYLFSFFHSSL